MGSTLNAVAVVVTTWSVPFGAECLAPDVQHGGDGEEDSEHPLVHPSSVIH